MLLYFRIADKYNIIDKPNERSSHDYITIRGGGIVFWAAGVLYVLFYHDLPLQIPFLTGITLISAVSFWDDISSLPNKIRIIIHFLSISFVFYGLSLFSILPWYLIPAAYIFFVGILNAYNFMDGINGITGLYSLSILISLQYVNYKIIPFTDPGFIFFAILACIVFLFFNCRKRAKCFAGDVGSMGISFWIVTLLLQLMIKDKSLVWLFFLSVYGVDSICTILHRLYLRQNIFKAHRMHFYQILSNEWRISHLKVSILYAFVQLLVCGLIIYFREYRMLSAISATIVLLFAYLLKFKRNTIE
jgi:UDP-N-acetylmuramyl pentapeptide phosphotransferase/UDP-N-acetylglucosamine-1-phosphate transferase